MNAIWRQAHVHIPAHATKATQSALAPRSLFTVRALAVRGSLMQRSETCGVKGSQDCECRKRGWECDPSVCQCENTEHLKSRDNLGKPRRLALVGQDGNHYCQNSDIQRGIPAEVEIKRGKFGLGAFSVNGIRTGEFIGEYVGELLPNEEKRQPLRDHLDLNYNFGYNPNFCLDSGRVGNETRYINHGSDEQGESNTKAETRIWRAAYWILGWAIY
ncbi:hypothetical protein EI94DRAFT_1139654 [Lactarius quietus]|nr:hypothetical protein EI94DRAFT_1139654 [Lactarius quietus]